MHPLDPIKTPRGGHINPNELHLLCKLSEVIELIGYLHDDLKTLSRKVEHHMSAFSDKIAELAAAISAETTQVQTSVAGLKAQIAELQAKVDAGLATPEDIAALDAAIAGVKAIDPTDPTTIPTP